MTAWAIVTGEYPPQAGGVSDHSRQLAAALAAAGDEVHVFAPAAAGPTPQDPGVTMHRLPSHFGARALRTLAREAERLPHPRRMLVQYVPHALGMRGMNLPFCAWLLRRRGFPVWVLFHEVAYPLEAGQPLRHHLLARVNRAMAGLAARAAARVLVTIPAWERVLREVWRGVGPVVWLPVPSNVPTEADPEEAAALRRAHPGERIGSFGAFGPLTLPLLRTHLPPILARRDGSVAVLVGRGSEEAARQIVEAHPWARERVVAMGALPTERVAACLLSCDLLLQLYPDGASSRRTTLMAGLALGVPVLTRTGPLSEEIWRTSGAVALAPADDPEAVTETAAALLADPAARAELGRRGERLYRDTFTLQHAVRRLRA
jgi:glycosyltransferase involved in cell wall biosynthesis